MSGSTMRIPSTSSGSISSLESTRKTSWASQPRSNPVAGRVFQVLSTKYDDRDTKEALQMLSSIYAPPASSKGKDVRRPADDVDEEVVPSGVTAVYDPAFPNEPVSPEAATRVRKDLRRDMENKLYEGTNKFLRVFEELDQKLELLQNDITAMRISCDEAETQLKLTNEAGKTLLERAGHLNAERQEVEEKKLIASTFLARFTLTESQINALTSKDASIGDHFFKAMDKTEAIREDCRALMSGEDGPTVAGQDIMAATSSYLEQGYDKILRWCSYEFRQIGREPQIDVTSVMKEAIRRLRKRPELLTEALTILSETRQTTLLTSFNIALTRGAPSGLPRPIELHAHDPMRYVGDMLAWVHQAIAAEQEFLESLFGVKSDKRMVGSVRVFDELNEEQDWIRELLDLAVSKLCVPLKVRVQQTVGSQESSIVIYKIANLLQFYYVTMIRTIGQNALLSRTLKEMTELAYNTFYDTVENQTRDLSSTPLQLDDPSLTPPLSILDHGQVLREIMTVYQSSLLGDEPEAEREEGFRRVLDTMVDPVVEHCINMAEDTSELRPTWDTDIFVINCLSYILSVMQPFSFTAPKQSEVQAKVEERVLLLTDHHFHHIIQDAGLKELDEICERIAANPEPMSHIPNAQPHELQAALHHFSEWLSGPEVVQSPRLGLLAVQRHHLKIHRAALERLAQAYQRICDEVKKPSNRYEAASTLLGSERPFGQMHLLWQIFGLESTK